MGDDVHYLQRWGFWMMDFSALEGGIIGRLPVPA